jgi:outer membrane protein TolC
MYLRRQPVFLTLAFPLLFSITAAAQKTFTQVDSLLQYAATKSISLQTGRIRTNQAKEAKLAALLGIADVSGGVTFSYTNNTQLPVNLFPAEAFGGAAGSYKEVQTGVQYNTTFNQNLDIKLLNLKGWESLKQARINIRLSESDQQVALQQLHENICTIYFNIVNLQQQLDATRQNRTAADSLLAITQRRYRTGVTRQQDVNDATISLLNTEESMRQIEYTVSQQYLALKLLCDIPENEAIIIAQRPESVIQAQPPVQTANAAIHNSQLKEQLAWSNYRHSKYALYPTISFFQAYNNQQFNTRGRFFDSKANWIPSSYIGLRLQIPIPNSNAIGQLGKAKYDYQLAKKNTEQQQIQARLERRQLEVDYEKALSQALTDARTYELRRDTYEKNMLLYKEGLIAFDRTLSSYNELVNSQYKKTSAATSVQLALARIKINNSFK